MSVKLLSRIFVSAAFAFACQGAIAATAAEIARDANASLQQLYAAVPAAKTLGASASAILVFPKVTKAGLGVGGQYGEGALLKEAPLHLRRSHLRHVLRRSLEVHFEDRPIRHHFTCVRTNA